MSCYETQRHCGLETRCVKSLKHVGMNGTITDRTIRRREGSYLSLRGNDRLCCGRGRYCRGEGETPGSPPMGNQARNDTNDCNAKPGNDCALVAPVLDVLLRC